MIDYYKKYKKYKTKYLLHKNDSIETRINIPRLIFDMKNKSNQYQKLLDDFRLSFNVSQLIKQTPNSFIDFLCSKIPQQISTHEDNIRRINRRIRSIESVISNKILSTYKYLDIGCNDGTITRGIAQYYKFDPNNVYGVDVKVWYGKQNDCGLNNMFFVDENNPKLPYPDNYFDIITCFQVLHHVVNQQATINELKRVLKYGGFLILREHDMLYNNPNISNDLIHFEHIIYMCSKKSGVDIKNYYGNYKSKHEWNKMIKLKIIKCINSNNTTRYYTCGYVK